MAVIRRNLDFSLIYNLLFASLALAGLVGPLAAALLMPAPILPSGPEPGTPEADAELAELLEESTLTQDEFDKAFRGGGPKIDGDQFVFEPNERSRKQPLVEQGEPKISGSSP